MSWAEENAAWLAAARDSWAPTEAIPLRLRAWMASPVAYDGYDGITIEGALQAVVCMRETGRLSDDVFSSCPRMEKTDIQVPIADTVLGGDPVAHASIGWCAPDAMASKRQGWKRARADSYGKDVVKISEAWAKTQMVLKATVTTIWVDFFVVGDEAKLRALLVDVSHLGAGRSSGLGQVHGWEVTRIREDWSWIGPGKRLMRTLPLDAAVSLGVANYDEREATIRAPYWHPLNRRLCAVPVQSFGERMGEVAGGFFITPHAVRRYRERVTGMEHSTYDQLLGALIRAMGQAHFVKQDHGGLELWRGPRPHRLRFRVAPGIGGMLPQVVTVLRGKDRLEDYLCL